MDYIHSWTHSSANWGLMNFGGGLQVKLKSSVVASPAISSTDDEMIVDSCWMQTSNSATDLILFIGADEQKFALHINAELWD